MSIGLHPWLVQTETIETLENKILAFLQFPNICAIGEVGLDKFTADFSKQEEVFAMQVDLAKKYKLPLIIHQVKSANELFKQVKDFAEPIVLHGYSGSLEQWKQFNAHLPTYVSFGKALLNPSSKVRESIQHIPLKNILLETDNAPIQINTIYEAFAQIRNEPLETIAQQIEFNFKTVFRTT
jgi:TatD DNase family protein